MAMKGEPTKMTVALRMIRTAPPARRAEFAREIWADANSNLNRQTRTLVYYNESITGVQFSPVIRP